MNEFRQGPGDMREQDLLKSRKGMTGEQLVAQEAQAQLDKHLDTIDPLAEGDEEDRLGITTDAEIDEALEIGGPTETQMGGSDAIVGSRLWSRIMETPKTMMRGFKRGDRHRGDEKTVKPVRVPPPHKESRP